MQTSEKKRNQRKSPLTPKKSFKKDDSPPTITTRVGGRLKKAKIPFDPSTYSVSKRRQTEPTSSIKFPTKRIDAPTSSQRNVFVCCICKKIDRPDSLIHCKGECDTRVHLNCLQSTCERFGKDEELTWECHTCQTCRVCAKNHVTDDTLLKCYICFSYYHIKCHGLEDKIKVVKENRFGCRLCVSDKSQKSSPSNNGKSNVPKKTRAFSQTRVKPANAENKFSNDGKVGFLGFNANEVHDDSSSDDDANEQKNVQRRYMTNNSDRRSAQIQKRSSGSSENHNSIDEDADIPDATEWSAEEVFRYFQSKFPQHAHVFKHHEIDGPSLYLLKRGDVVKGFNIKIGPALKIYGHIMKLQTKCCDPTLSWQ